MNTYQKKLVAYYAKQFVAAFGFAALYCLSFLTGTTDNSAKITAMYEEYTKRIPMPVKVKLDAAARSSVKVA